MGNFKNLTGQRFSRLIVIERVKNHIQPNGSQYVQWLCKCDCGNEVIVLAGHLVSGHTKSCGCLHKEKLTKHGKSRTKIYQVYRDMKARCYNPNCKPYKNYGGRGIKICNEWKNNFKIFYDWAINNGYQDNLTIDRIDVNGNYEPSNCRWVNKYIQSRNRRTNRYITYNNETHCITDWAEIYGIRKDIIKYRLEHNWSIEKTLTTPVAKKKTHKVICVETNKIYKSTVDASKKTNIRVTTISNCCSHRCKTAGGYHWEYIKENKNK